MHATCPPGEVEDHGAAGRRQNVGGRRGPALGLPDALDLFFTRILRDAFALDASDTFKPFREIAGGAAHAWDLEGARRAGLVTAWASRLELRYHPAMPPPDVSAPDLVGVAESLLSLG